MNEKLPIYKASKEYFKVLAEIHNKDIEGLKDQRQCINDYLKECELLCQKKKKYSKVWSDIQSGVKQSLDEKIDCYETEYLGYLEAGEEEIALRYENIVSVIRLLREEINKLLGIDMQLINDIRHLRKRYLDTVINPELVKKLREKEELKSVKKVKKRILSFNDIRSICSLFFEVGSIKDIKSDDISEVKKELKRLSESNLEANIDEIKYKIPMSLGRLINNLGKQSKSELLEEIWGKVPKAILTEKILGSALTAAGNCQNSQLLEEILGKVPKDILTEKEWGSALTAAGNCQNSQLLEEIWGKVPKAILTEKEWGSALTAAGNCQNSQLLEEIWGKVPKAILTEKQWGSALTAAGNCQNSQLLEEIWGKVPKAILTEKIWGSALTAAGKCQNSQLLEEIWGKVPKAILTEKQWGSALTAAGNSQNSQLLEEIWGKVPKAILTEKQWGSALTAAGNCQNSQLLEEIWGKVPEEFLTEKQWGSALTAAGNCQNSQLLEEIWGKVPKDILTEKIWGSALTAAGNCQNSQLLEEIWGKVPKAILTEKEWGSALTAAGNCQNSQLLEEIWGKVPKAILTEKIWGSALTAAGNCQNSQLLEEIWGKVPKDILTEKQWGSALTAAGNCQNSQLLEEIWGKVPKDILTEKQWGSAINATLKCNHYKLLLEIINTLIDRGILIYIKYFLFYFPKEILNKIISILEEKKKIGNNEILAKIYYIQEQYDLGKELLESNGLERTLIYADILRKLRYYKESLDILSKLDSNEDKIDHLTCKAYCLFHIGEYKKSLQIFNQLLEEVENDDIRHSRVLTGYVYLLKESRLDIDEKIINNLKTIKKQLNNYISFTNIETEKDHIQRALNILNELLSNNYM